ncbi:MAG: DMT family transporter [Pseudomonadota bacterium]
MRRAPGFGLVLAVTGALILSPDALFMRLSDMGGLQMSGWRGLCMGTVMWLAWLSISSNRIAELKRLCCRLGAVLIVAQVCNSLFFSLGIANAPVAIVVMGVAATPVWAALLSQFALGEPAGRATWWTIAAVLLGMAIALFGGSAHETDALALDPGVLLGALFGLGTALVLAANFVTLRARPDLPLLPAIGTGALIAGCIGWTATGTTAMMDGMLWAILLTGALILPLSFFLLSQATRYTHAAHVSLIMLLEAVLSPLWVWWALGEELSPAMLTGAALVIGALTAFLVTQRPRKKE